MNTIESLGIIIKIVFTSLTTLEGSSGSPRSPEIIIDLCDHGQ